ncbi:MAG: RluA family pseudouridine synthase [Planctomycetes bacterium]|nr:RluA family pseudouridine synthase [Planctomycetota bacterium]
MPDAPKTPHADAAAFDAEQEFALDAAAAGKRLDVALHDCLPGRSRSFLAKLLKEGAILLDGKSAKPNKKVKGGERVAIDWPEPEVIEAKPEAIPLAILYEDGDIAVVNKPFGMPSHPGPGHSTGTLVNALLAHCKDLSSINGALRPGIVHRLDMDTSGVIVTAKNDRAHQSLQEQFAERKVAKQYVALCHGDPKLDTFANSGRIGRHPVRRTEMTVMKGADEGRDAHTDFQVLQRMPKSECGPVFLVLAKPRTGRTHQIRVHLAKLGYPILADAQYGKLKEEAGLARHALHAWKIAFTHPGTQEKLNCTAPLADDMVRALARLGGKPLA